MRDPCILLPLLPLSYSWEKGGGGGKPFKRPKGGKEEMRSLAPSLQMCCGFFIVPSFLVVPSLILLKWKVLGDPVVIFILHMRFHVPIPPLHWRVTVFHAVRKQPILRKKKKYMWSYLASGSWFRNYSLFKHFENWLRCKWRGS